MAHKLGLHWMRHHYDSHIDLPHIKTMGYFSFTLFEESWSNPGFCNELLSVAAPGAIFLLRDHPLSEQKPQAVDKPREVGRDHGDQWQQKWSANRIHLPKERCYHLGLNEFDTNQYPRQNNDYTAAFASRLHDHGLLCAGWSFGVGHPSTYDLRPDKPPNWEWYEESAELLIKFGGIAALHEYWLPGNYNWGNWVGRFMQHCPYDIKVVIKESLYDSGLQAKFPNQGYKSYIDMADPVQVAGMLGELNGYLSRFSKDPRLHSVQCFTYDFAHPWSSFNIREIRHHFERFPWHMAVDNENGQQPIKPPVVKPPLGKVALLLPLDGVNQLTQRFGMNPDQYARFGCPGHNGVDYTSPLGVNAKVVAAADGQVQWVGEDGDYGKYVRIFHPHLGLHSFDAHLSSQAVRQGQEVEQGDFLGQMGSTGNSTGPHVHREIRLAHPDGSYKQGQFGYGKGRVDPQTVYDVLNL